MPSVLGTIIESIIDIMKEMEWDGEMYYRGETKSHYKLVPKLLRNSDEYVNSIFLRENEIYCRTIVMAEKEAPVGASSWQTLALFQHYQLPTRLLDWSSSLITAIMFAIEPCLECKKTLCATSEKCSKKDYSPRIWILIPRLMHSNLHQKTSLEKLFAVTIGVDDNKIQDYLSIFVQNKNQESKWKYKNGPIFLEIPWNNPRIRAQKGFFTFHANATPLEDVPGSYKWLTRIEISRDLILTLKKEISLIGANEFDIYPDISNLAKYFDRQHTRKSAINETMVTDKTAKRTKSSISSGTVIPTREQKI